MTDEQILKRLKAGQPEALEALMEKYRRYVRSVIFGVVGGRGGAEDVEELTQDVFYAVWSHGAEIRGNLRGYLGAAARNRAKSFLRSCRELSMDLDTVEIADTGKSLEDAARQEELSRYIQRAIDKMRPKDREIFLRYYFHLQTGEEIAAEMGIPKGTVFSRLSRGRKILKKILSKEGLP